MMIRARFLRTALKGALFLLLLPACNPAPQPPVAEAELHLADFVAHQRFNVTTDLISIPHEIGLSHFEYGWQPPRHERQDQSSYTIAESVGRLLVFSADGDLAEIALELGLQGQAGPQSLPVEVEINDQFIGRIEVEPGWADYRLPVSPGPVRVGFNLLSLRPRIKQQQGRQPPRVQLRRLRLRSRSGRQLWPQRPGSIEWSATESGPSHSRAVEMPSSSYLDMVFSVPSGARLLGSFDFEPAPDNDSQAVDIYAQLLDEQAPEQILFHHRLMRGPGRSRQISIDLGAWTGQLVRLRLRISGSGNGMVHWQDLRIDGTEPAQLITALPPIKRQAPTPSDKLGRPDVLVILLDAARADAFSPFGGPYPTPHTERLARNGTVFQQALSPSSWTGQSVPSIFTGHFPDTLYSGPYGSRLPDDVTTLAELMAADGYRTVLWSQHPLYTNYSGFARGFQEIHRTTKGDYQSLPRSDHLMADDQPTFAFVHLIPPHAPYEPPPPFRGAYSSWYSGEMPVDVRHLNRFSRQSDPQALSEDDLRYTRDRYLENVAFADDLVGQILTLYDRAYRYQETLIILLSDHGEAFMEHGRFLHTRYLYQEFLHVPLVVKWPASVAGSSSTVSEPVSLVDLTPSLADGLGLAGAELGFQGRSLLPLVFDRLNSRGPLYAMTRGGANPYRPPKPQVLLETGGWRLLYSPLLDHSELFRTDLDPMERKNLAADLPLRALLLRQSLLSQMEWNRQLLSGSGAEGALEELDPETIEQLKALGYLQW